MGAFGMTSRLYQNPAGETDWMWQPKSCEALSLAEQGVLRREYARKICDDLIASLEALGADELEWVRTWPEAIQLRTLIDRQPSAVSEAIERKLIDRERSLTGAIEDFDYYGGPELPGRAEAVIRRDEVRRTIRELASVYYAQGIEARSDETRSGSAEGESPARDSGGAQ